MGEGARRRYHTRLLEAMLHASRYAFEGKIRLARDTGLNKTTILRLLSGAHVPSYLTVHRVVSALEKELSRRLDIRELISYDGEYERPICEVVGCKGCLPPGIVTEDGSVDPLFQHIEPGKWMSFRDFQTPPE